MITVLQYLVIAAAIGLVVFFLAVLVFGRGEELAPLPVRTSPAELPEKGVAGGDVRAVRFAVSVRGYRMSDVDWTLDRLADETDRLRAEVRRLGGDPDAVSDRALWDGQPDDGADGRSLEDSGGAPSAPIDDSREFPAPSDVPVGAVPHRGGDDHLGDDHLGGDRAT